MNSTDTTQHDEAFLPILWVYIQQHRRATHPHTRKKLREGLKDALKKWTDTPVKMASEAAAALAANCQQDIFQFMWTDRHRCGIEAGRSNILWEHTTPLNEAFETLVEFADQTEVRQWMQSYSGVCWITREEDNELNRRATSPRDRAAGSIVTTDVESGSWQDRCRIPRDHPRACEDGEAES